ncbi:MAG: hypothetical protein A3F84_14260 [Candidatus Handelsmanbacteria bacterium RIFCSPLOWO2_12_FULL_64_10]|uniref:Oligopeptide transporter OPT family protein n=1 Tax=Handelsmanbacteria sp. (strain RIFCSPLOWO2_12_FULL_64_10) TaxID=1817868 RepID=A0A1F6CIC9_HANXR|nr:MAG: hypothetical protein A3F84_14260 [Candidatus Handelsmanbacteria bacterium RIFCSPLOWO2_12_FULL_64_10]
MTRRAFLLGLAMAAWVNLWPAYASLIAHSSRADYAQLSEAFLVPFLCLLGLNLFLDRLGRGLSSSELLAVSCMGMVAALMQGEWLSGYFLGIITASTYFATPENRWEELLFPHIPDWGIVADRRATVGFYESLPKGAPIPWQPWAAPLLWWGGFLGAVLLAGFCLSVILRKQWMEHERLAFPIATALLELTGVSGSGQAFSTLVRSRLFQVGFWVVLGSIAWNIVGWFVTAFPLLPVLSRRTISIGRGFPALWFKVHPMTIAFGYFTKSEVLLSIWVFHLLAILQVGLLDRIGLDIGPSDPWCSFNPAVGWQSFGSLIVFVCWSLWIARAHLKEVFEKAFTGKGGVDDSGELIPYRAAVFLLLGCALYLIFWLRQAGMAWGPLLAFWFGTLVLYLGLARIIVESGLVYLRGPITAQAFTWHLFGISGMGPASATALALTYTFFCDAKTFGMTMLAHIPRLGVAMHPRRRRMLVPAVLLAALVGAAAVTGFTLYYGYCVMGSYNFGVVSFNGSNNGAIGIWRLSASRIQQGTFGTDWNRVAFLGIGGAFTGLLSYLRYRFPGFPVHPIGFAISASEILRSSTASIFIVWLVKTLLLKFGGLERYRKTAPLFLGMAIGYVAGIGLGVAVDVLWFNGDGHSLTGW